MEMFFRWKKAEWGFFTLVFKGEFVVKEDVKYVSGGIISDKSQLGLRKFSSMLDVISLREQVTVVLDFVVMQS